MLCASHRASRWGSGTRAAAPRCLSPGGSRSSATSGHHHTPGGRAPTPPRNPRAAEAARSGTRRAPGRHVADDLRFPSGKPMGERRRARGTGRYVADDLGSPSGEPMGERRRARGPGRHVADDLRFPSGKPMGERNAVGSACARRQCTRRTMRLRNIVWGVTNFQQKSPAAWQESRENLACSNGGGFCGHDVGPSALIVSGT